MFKHSTSTKLQCTSYSDGCAQRIIYNKYNGKIVIIDCMAQQTKGRKRKRKNKKDLSNSWEVTICSFENKSKNKYKLPIFMNFGQVYEFVAVSEDMYALWVFIDDKYNNKQENMEKMIQLQKDKVNDRKQEEEKDTEKSQTSQQYILIFQTPSKPSSSSQNCQLQLKQSKLVPLTVHPPTLSHSQFFSVSHTLLYHEHLNSLSLQYTYKNKQGNMVVNNLNPPHQQSKPSRVIRMIYMEVNPLGKIVNICEYYSTFMNVFENSQILHPRHIDYPKYNENKSNATNITTNNNTLKLDRLIPLIILYTPMPPFPFHLMNAVQLNRQIKIYIFAMNPYQYKWPPHRLGCEVRIEGYEIGLDNVIEENIMENEDNGELDKQQPQQQEQQEQEQQIQQMRPEDSQEQEQQQADEPEEEKKDTNELIVSICEEIQEFGCNKHENQNQTSIINNPTTIVIITKHNSTLNLLRVQLKLSQKSANILSVAKFVNNNKKNFLSILNVQYINFHIFVTLSQKPIKSENINNQKYFVHIFACDNQNIFNKYHRINRVRISPQESEQNLTSLFKFVTFDINQRYRLAFIQQNKKNENGDNKVDLNMIQLVDKQLIYMKMLTQMYSKKKESAKQMEYNDNEHYFIQIIGKQALMLL